tara:strand:+ start:1157 stop:2377 length:1221 start_codon:yes stop_codon:yes gene_type:complete
MFMIAPQAAYSEEKSDDAICKNLQSLIEDAHLKQMPSVQWDLSSWVKSQSDNSRLSMDEETDSGKILDWLKARGVVSGELEEQIAAFSDDNERWRLKQVLPPVVDDVTVIHATVGTDHCENFRLIGRDKNNHWTMQPRSNVGEGEFCGMTSVVLARLQDKNVFVRVDAYERSADFHLSELNGYDYSKSYIEGLTCSFRAEFERRYLADVVGETELGGVCRTPICKFLVAHADEIGEAMKAGKPPTFVMTSGELTNFSPALLAELNWPTDNPRFEAGYPSSPSGWNLNEMWPDNSDWLIWQPFVAEWFTVSKSNHQLHKLDWPVPEYRTSFSFIESESFAQYTEWPFMSDGKMYVLRIGAGQLGYRYYPGFIFEVAEYDGTQFHMAANGEFDETGGGDPTFSKSFGW